MQYWKHIYSMFDINATDRQVVKSFLKSKIEYFESIITEVKLQNIRQYKDRFMNLNVIFNIHLNTILYTI